MQRRTFITASAAALAAPSLARAQSASVFKWIPQADISSLDPVWTTAYVARTHGFLVFDTLYGQSGPHGGYTATPQMVEGHVIENDGKTWKLTLREGLLFHDGTKVLARDCVASIKRWAARDTLGLTLMSITNELTAPDDKTIVFRLKKPFPLLAEALGKTGSPCCVIMPERLANTDPFKQVTEMVGSGPYRFKPDERVQGAFFAYERFQNYLPRPTGETEWISGPKIAHFDRVEFHVIPDASTAAAAMKSGEMDGWEFPTGDLLPLLDRERHLKRELVYETGFAVFCRLNHRQPPFDNPAIRRALFAAIDQDAAIIAAMGDDPTLRKNPLRLLPARLADGQRRGHAEHPAQARLRQGKDRPQGSRLQRRDHRLHGGDRHPDLQSRRPDYGRFHAAGRPECRCPGFRLRHDHPAPRQQEASLRRRLERVLRHDQLRRILHPGHT